MASYKGEKLAYKRHMVLKGDSDPKENIRMFPGIPERILSRWERDLLRVEPPKECPKVLRLINRFSIGADPEFSLEEKGEQVYGSTLGLKTGLAYGADLNGRLLELRPSPSRFALEVVASLWSTLKWFYRTVPTARNTVWVAGAWHNQDGLGGHVHLGQKKKPTDEIKALDTVVRILAGAEVYNERHLLLRRERSEYGRWGDIRPQPHGYEYRVFPSWLGSPLEAYLSLVLSKLVVYDPSLFNFKARPSKAKAYTRRSLVTF